ncbi:MAG: HAD-IC family P-type ATPase [Clostridia bacterium]|nr:HAD-IC family P-type ATPase [Clostridia bacterium]
MSDKQNIPPTPSTGLTEEQAASRPKNIVTDAAGKTVWQIIAGNLFTPFNGLNAALALCLALVGSWRNMLFMGVVISNTLIGTVQELRARATLRRLRLMNMPEAHVLRGGTERTVKPEELVLGDLVILRAGDQVPADAKMVSGTGTADESLLTGESIGVAKAAGDMLLSGSYIMTGRVVARLTCVGDDSYAARLTRSARENKRPRSALMLEMNKLIRLVSAILVPLGVLLFCREYFIDDVALASAVPSAVAAMVGMIPEGLMLLTSVAMAVGVVKLGRHGTLVQELYGIETLARADVLCLDKTGTLTTGRMQLQQLIPLGEGVDENALRAALSRFLGAMEDASPTLDALRAAVPAQVEEPVSSLPFSAERKLSAATFADGTTLLLGAPSFLLTQEQLAPHQGRIAALSEAGGRVLALAEARAQGEADAAAECRFLGLCVLSDELRPHVRQTLQYFARQGVTLKVISGDDPRTAAAIARQAGLDMTAAQIVDASGLTDAALAEKCGEGVVFGRVTPAQKKLLVEALEARGHHVAMTGDGVNDIPALKVANCSIAMPGGAQAARQVAQLCLLEGDFAALPLVVGEGRRVMGNITRAASLFLVKTLYSFALALLVLFLPVAYPFQPIQLTLVSTLTIGLPSFFLALEPNQARVRGDFLHTVLLRAVPGAAAVTLCALAAMLSHAFFGWTEADCSTLATLSAGVMGLLMLLTVCWPPTRMRVALLVAMTAAFVGAVLLLGRVFCLSTLTGPEGIALLVLIAAAAGVMALTTLLMRRKWRKK